MNSIYGVDIDSQAVEVTKLSLLLKVLEGESAETINQQFKFFHERALPDLGENIKCGNSLIGSDFYADAQLNLLDADDRQRINAFDWESEFPGIFQDSQPGFGIVIGNPPYIRIQALNEWAPDEVAFCKKRYASAGAGSFDIYVLFVERALSLMSGTGRLGFILPSKFFSTDYGAPLREMLTQQEVVDEVVDFGYEQVFERSTTYTCLLFLDRRGQGDVGYVRAAADEVRHGRVPKRRSYPTTSLGRGPWAFLPKRATGVLLRLAAGTVRLLELQLSMSRGTSTGADDVFCLTRQKGHHMTRDGNIVEIEDTVLRQPIYATDFGRYLFAPENRERILFPYVVSATGYRLL